MDTNRLTYLRKHLSMLRAAHAHLSPTGRFLNAGRIREAEAELESIETWLAIVERDGGVYADNGQFVAIS